MVSKRTCFLGLDSWSDKNTTSAETVPRELLLYRPSLLGIDGDHVISLSRKRNRSPPMNYFQQ